MEDFEISLRSARVNKELSVEQVHEITGFSKARIYKWEANVIAPSIEEARVLCQLYGISLNNLRF